MANNFLGCDVFVLFDQRQNAKKFPDRSGGDIPAHRSTVRART